MKNYKLIIQYDGGRYKGWQRLPEQENTIQSKVEQVISRMLEYPVEIIACSRTDAGVHALEQVANFKSKERLDTEFIKTYLNEYLPDDIAIIRVEEVDAAFHARYHCKEKVYLYRIWNREESNPFLRKYSMHVREALDLEAMQAATKYFIGEHDFSAFSNAKSKKKSSVRVIEEITIEDIEGLIEVRIRGNGFLYNMVRWMVGALVETGLKKMQAQKIAQVLEAGERGKAGDLAPACGLFLEQIIYESDKASLS